MMPKKMYVILALVLSLLLASCQLMPVEETLPEVPVIRDYEKKTYDQSKVMRGDLILSEDVRCTYEITRQDDLGFSIGGGADAPVFFEQS